MDEDDPDGVGAEPEQRLDEQAGSLHQIDDMTALAICARAAVSAAPAKAARRAA